MLTGSVPFDDPSPASLALQHLTLSPPPPREINPALNAQTEAILLKALSKAPDERFPSGHVLMNTLEKALRAGPLAAAEAAHQPAPSKSGRRSGTHPMLIAGVGLFALAAIVVLGIAIGGLFNNESLSEEAPQAPQQAAVSATNSQPPSPTAQSTNVLLTAEEQTPAAAQATNTTLPDVVITGTTDATLTPIPIQPTSTSFLSPAPTVLYSNGYRIVLIYNERGFYFWNPGDERLSVSSAAFEALDAASGSPTVYRFAGTQWAQFFGTLFEQNCDALEVTGLSTVRPPECRAINAERTRDSASTWMFFLPRAGVTQFRMLWNAEEIARCEIADGRCEAFLP